MSAGQVYAHSAGWGKLAKLPSLCALAWERREPWLAVVWALLITIGQILLACLLSGEGRFQDAYLRLFQWDGHWYGHIVEKGYQSPAHLYFVDRFFMKMNRRGVLPFGNVAFFPAYPLLGRFLHTVFGLRTERALLVVSQISCWGFWTYVLLFFQRWRVSGAVAVCGVLAVLVHPASFFLVSSYSEALYLTALLGFLYWADQPGLGSASMCAIHGFLMTATRLVGLPLVIWPFCQAYLKRTSPKAILISSRENRTVESGRRFVSLVGVSAVAAMGAVAFFAFCQWRFGQWDLYMKTEEAGWRVHPNYWGILSPKIFSIHWPKFGLFDPIFLNRLFVPVTLASLVAVAILEWRLARAHRDTGWRDRLGFYFCGWVMFYVCVSGHASRGMSSMVRFSLCSQAMWVLAFVHLASRVRLPSALLAPRVIFWLVVCALIALAHQLGFTYQFTHAGWVA